MAGVTGAMTDGMNGVDGRDGTSGRTGRAGLGQILIGGGKANLRSGLKIRPRSLKALNVTAGVGKLPVHQTKW